MAVSGLTFEQAFLGSWRHFPGRFPWHFVLLAPQSPRQPLDGSKISWEPSPRKSFQKSPVKVAVLLDQSFASDKDVVIQTNPPLFPFRFAPDSLVGSGEGAVKWQALNSIPAKYCVRPASRNQPLRSVRPGGWCPPKCDVNKNACCPPPCLSLASRSARHQFILLVI
ncbi:hypothetical protein LZ32DRAFT_402621 [Colletotrichum eremochloae]|nr:hypothetical protein LZ32DRAFT_402621 [Colletotrichum eremochloae]